MKALLIMNPTAGKRKSKNKLYEIIKGLSSANRGLYVYFTKNKGDAKQYLSKHAHKFELIICCGGDGTLNEALNGVTQTNLHPRFAYIPTGTINDFARSFNIPKNVAKALKIIKEGKPRKFDYGSIEDKKFIYTAAFGKLTCATYKTPQSLKHALGKLAYLITGAYYFFKNENHHIVISYDGKRIESDFMFGSISNSKSLGGTLRFRSDLVKLDDGLFESLFVKNTDNIIELLKIFFQILSENYNDPHVIFFRASEISIKSSKKITWCIDGELGGKYDSVVIKNHRQGAEIITKK